MRKMKKKLVQIFVVLILIIFTMTTASAASASMIKIGIKVNEKNLTPHSYNSEGGYQLTKLIYDSLFIVDENLEVIPWLAEECTVSDDGLIYTFKLHSGVTFHDGQPLTAEDVKFTYDYLLENPTTASRFSNPAAVISEINVIDELTVEMILSAPSVEFLNKPIAEMGILPKHIWENIEDATATTIDQAIGSGAYKMVEMKDGEYYRLEAYSGYVLGAPVADEIYIPIITDNTALFTALKSGEIDATNVTVPSESVSSFQSGSNLKVVSGAGFASTNVTFNCERYPLSLPEFRTALAYATDSQEIIDIIVLGNAVKGSLGYVHPSLSNYNPDVNVIEFDLDKANEILDGLNFMDTDGDGVRETEEGDKLSFEILATATSPDRIRTAEILRDWYIQIGVELTVSAVDTDVMDMRVWPEFNAANGRDFDMTMFGWGASSMNSATRLYSIMYSDLTKGTSNIGAYSNAGLDAVLDELMAETDLDKRDELIKEVQEIYSNDFGAITLYYADLVYAYNPEVYDGWVFQLGSGIINNLSLIDRTGAGAAEPEQTDNAAEESPSASPSEAPANEGTADSGYLWWIISGVAVVAIVVIVVVRTRSKGKK